MLKNDKIFDIYYYNVKDMVNRTYCDKICTIVLDSKLNSGLNPVSELHHGNGVYSRMLLHFDHTDIKKKIEDKTYANVEKLHHYLRMTNAGSIDFTEIHCDKISDISNGRVKRAASFDLIFFLIPMFWDGGKGFDMVYDKFSFKGNSMIVPHSKTRLLSEDGCNWFQPRNGYKWKEEGIYSTETLSREYENLASDCGSSIILCRQHFDIGNENINIDITDLVNKYVNEEIPNYGIGVAFTPMTEIEDSEIEEYCSFFTHKTNSFFEPFVETVYDDYISDDRGSFCLNKNNRLYLYCNIGSIATNLDELPTCTIDDIQYEVKQYSKGIYYAEVFGDSSVFRSNTMYYDVWSNIKYDGVSFDDIEMDFVVHGQLSFFYFGNTLSESTHFTSAVYGIKEEERIKRGDLRKVSILARQNYSKNRANVIDEMYYRLYVMDGTRELDIINWSHVNKTVKENFFNIDTNMLLPQKYYVDIKYKYNMEEISERNVLSFYITDDLNNKYN